MASPDMSETLPMEPTTGPLTLEELQLAGRNRGMPLEALRYDITLTGLHYRLSTSTSRSSKRASGA